MLTDWFIPLQRTYMNIPWTPIKIQGSSVRISSVNVWWIFIKGEVTPEIHSSNEQSRDCTLRDYFALSSSFISLLSYSIFFIFPVHSFYLSLQYSNSCPILHFPHNPVSPRQFFFSFSFLSSSFSPTHSLYGDDGKFMCFYTSCSVATQWQMGVKHKAIEFTYNMTSGLIYLFSFTAQAFSFKIIIIL